MTPIAVCIVAFRDAPQIVACLEALGRSDFPDFQVVICENGGAQAYADLVARVPLTLAGGQAVTTYRAEGNLGYAGGVNLCMRATTNARAWWILNPDTTPAPGALTALVARLERGDCAAVGGVLYHPDGKVQAYGGHWRMAMARAVSIGHGAAMSDRPDASAIEKRTDYLLGASMLVGRTMVERVGLMKEDYFLYAEEVEWCLRAGKAGLRLGFAPDARICHGQGATTGSADSIRERPRLPIYLDERNKLNVVRDTAPIALITAIPATFLLSLLRFARKGAWRQQGYALQGWLAGVRNERGIPGWMRNDADPS